MAAEAPGTAPGRRASLFAEHPAEVRMAEWRKPEDYAYTDKLRLHDWAWEFLRRNKRYQAASKKYWDGCLAGFGSLSDFSEASYPFNLDEPVEATMNALEADVPWSQYVGMHMLSDYVPSSAMPYVALGEDDADVPLSNLALNFDLTMPIDPQIKQATEHLQFFQKAWLDWVRTTEPGVQIGSKRRPQVDKFKGYIRALDGEAAGASQEKIGEVLFPEAADPRDAARYALKAGRDMADRGYLDLLLMENR